MRLFSFGVARNLVLAVPCALALAAAAATPATAINLPDRKASCDRAGNENSLRSSFGADCARLGPPGSGYYRVTFPYFGGPGFAVCSVTGTIGSAGTLLPPFPGSEPFFQAGEIALSQYPNPPPGPGRTTVLVKTYSSFGVPTDLGFRILVSC